MKLPLVLLLNLLVVGGGIFAYDALKSDGRQDVDTIVAADRSQLESRVERIEESMARRGPELRSMGPEDLIARIVVLEDKVRTLGARASTTVRVPSDEPFQPASSESGLAARVDDDLLGDVTEAGGLDAKEVERVQRLMEAAERKSREERRQQQLDSTLERLNMNLSDEDKARVLEARDSFRTNIRAAFMKARESGLPREEMRGIAETARADFTVTLQSFLPASDAEQLSTALTAWGGRSGPGGFGGGRPGR